MAHCNWSAENATNAYLTTLQMGKRPEGENQPDVSEFISAIAAGNNSQLMVIACSSGPTTSAALALVAAANQTGGRVVCILPETLKHEEAIFDESYKQVECVIGEGRTLIVNEYREADFVLVDCNVESYERILKAVQRVAFVGGRKKEGVIVLGYNAFSAGSWRSRWGGVVERKAATQLLPIGGGLLITRVAGKMGGGCGFGRKGSWVVKVDEATGEEHVFRVRPTFGKVLHA